MYFVFLNGLHESSVWWTAHELLEDLSLHRICCRVKIMLFFNDLSFKGDLKKALSDLFLYILSVPCKKCFICVFELELTLAVSCCKFLRVSEYVLFILISCPPCLKVPGYGDT